MKAVVIPPYKKRDMIASHFIEGLYDNGLEVISSAPGNGIKRVYSDDEVIDHAKDADFIFCIWGKGNTQNESLFNKINRPEISAYVDGSEYAQGGGPVNENMYNNCGWYLRRECSLDDVEKGIVPFPPGCEKSYFRNYDLPKKYDLFCSFGQFITGYRSQIYDYCINSNLNNYIIKRDGNFAKIRLSDDEYFRTLTQSFVSVSSWGGGRWCYREWEVLANRVLCFVQSPTFVCSNKPEDGVDWVEYSDMNEFKEKMDYYLKNKELCIEIGNNGYNHALKYHTSKYKVYNILKKMNPLVVDIMGDGYEI